jgi:hypothetical protein
MMSSHPTNSSVPQDNTLRVTVFMAPTTGALTRLLVLVRGRGAKVLDLHWQVTPTEREGIATLLMSLDEARHPHLAAAIARIIDVRSVVVS